MCEPTGWCSFPDASCSAGSRYGAFAGDGLANTCVDGGNTESTAVAETVGASTSSTGPEEGTSSPDSSGDATSGASETAASTTEDVTPVCGDGVVDGDEDCDDGNDVPGDGCSAACERSGSIVWEVTVEIGGSSRADAVDQFADGDLAIGGVVTVDSVAVAGVSRIDRDGATVWMWQFPSSPWQTAAVWGLDVASVYEDELTAITVAGQAGTGSLGGIATIGEGGTTRWSVLVPDLVPQSAALDADGSVLGGGYDELLGGVVVRYSIDGTEVTTVPGEPFSPDDGFTYDVAIDGAEIVVAGQLDIADSQAAYLGIINLGGTVRQSFTPGTASEGLAIALDPNGSRRWICGFGSGVGGWVAAVGPNDIELDATVATDVFPAVLHGIAIDGSGAAIAVGWDSSEGTEDAYVVKITPDGMRVWNTWFATPGGDDGLRDVVVDEDGLFVVGTRVDDEGSPSGWAARLVP